ncbi:MAG: hypothetical protein KDD62_07685, partial [Bdellovibrionales bacterium]|nr:hypothetical protein [Bdellovibrionales bacterium]
MKALAEVLIPPMAQSFTYGIPDAFAEQIHAGYLVHVPLGARIARGFVVHVVRGDEASKVIEDAPFKIKNIVKLDEAKWSFHESQLEFFNWVARYYGSKLSTVLEAAVPRDFKKKVKKI